MDRIDSFTADQIKKIADYVLRIENMVKENDPEAKIEMNFEQDKLGNFFYMHITGKYLKEAMGNEYPVTGNGEIAEFADLRITPASEEKVNVIQRINIGDMNSGIVRELEAIARSKFQPYQKRQMGLDDVPGGFLCIKKATHDFKNTKFEALVGKYYELALENTSKD